MKRWGGKKVVRKERGSERGRKGRKKRRRDGGMERARDGESEVRVRERL